MPTIKRTKKGWKVDGRYTYTCPSRKALRLCDEGKCYRCDELRGRLMVVSIDFARRIANEYAVYFLDEAGVIHWISPLTPRRPYSKHFRVALPGDAKAFLAPKSFSKQFLDYCKTE
jgi:hypothetical protein